MFHETKALYFKVLLDCFTVYHMNGVQEAAGSTPVTRTNKKVLKPLVYADFRTFLLRKQCFKKYLKMSLKNCYYYVFTTPLLQSLFAARPHFDVHIH